MIRAYHFVGDTLRDGRPVPPDGEWLIHDGPAVMCKSGLHASRHPFDALLYAPGNVLCLVDCDDVVDEHSDKLLCRRRRIVARFDASRLLREFAADCAESVLHLVPAESQLACIWAIDAARRYARGECDDDERAAAAYAAANAARAYAVAAYAVAACASAAYAAHAARATAYDAYAAAAHAARAARDARDAQRQSFAALVDAAFAAIGENDA